MSESRSADAQIRWLVENYYDIQELRKAAFNRIVAYVKSQGEAETHPRPAKSQTKPEPQVQSASHSNVENHVHNAKSHANLENQPEGASHREGEAHSINASHSTGENQSKNASPHLRENQIGSASQCSDVNHDIVASQNKRETQNLPAKEVKPSVIAHRIIRQDVEVPKDMSELVWYHNSLYETEKQLAKRLNAWSSHRPIRINFLSRIYGIGPILSSGIIALVAPISRFPTISSLWAYAGLSAVHYECECDGKSKTNKKKTKHKFLVSGKKTECPVRIGKERVKCGAKVTSKFVNSPIRRKRGWLMFINPHLKVLCWKIAASFEKQKDTKSCYRRIYQQQKQVYLNRDDLAKPISDKVKGAKLHVRLMSMRYVAKRFLQDLWLFWRELEGLPVTKPYAHEFMGHTSFEPWEPDKPLRD